MMIWMAMIIDLSDFISDKIDDGRDTQTKTTVSAAAVTVVSVGVSGWFNFALSWSLWGDDAFLLSCPQAGVIFKGNLINCL